MPVICPAASRARPLPELQGGIQQPGLQEGVAVHHPEADELGALQAWDQAQHPFLLTPLQVGLEAHQVPERPPLSWRSCTTA